MNKKILFIVEGLRDRTFVKSVVKEMKLDVEVFPVKANIHMLYSILEKEDFQLNIVDIFCLIWIPIIATSPSMKTFQTSRKCSSILPMKPIIPLGNYTLTIQ